MGIDGVKTDDTEMNGRFRELQKEDPHFFRAATEMTYNCDDAMVHVSKTIRLTQPRCNSDNNATLDLILSPSIILPRSF